MTPETPPVGVWPSAQTDRFVHERLPPPGQRARLHYGAPALRIPAQANLVDVLLAGVAARALMGKAFLRSDVVTLTYGNAATRINQFAHVLTVQRGLQPGNRVLLRGGNSIGLALAWLGLVKAGLIAVATMPLLRARALRDVIHKAEPVLALCDAALLDELKAAQSDGGSLQSVLAFNTDNAPDSLDGLARGQSGVFTPCLTAADDTALMVSTSGTTGQP